MRLVIADTGPVNYLVLIGCIDFLPTLFDRVILPSAVQTELADPGAPLSVQSWMANPPPWLHIHEMPSHQSAQASVEGLDEGEAAAISLAVLLAADLLVMDDRRGVTVARAEGLRVTGTLGIIDPAARRGLIDFAEAVDRLRRTTFRIPEKLLDSLVKKHAEGSGSV